MINSVYALKCHHQLTQGWLSQKHLRISRQASLEILQNYLHAISNGCFSFRVRGVLELKSEISDAYGQQYGKTNITRV